jgi:hypothetical protein
MKLDRAKGARAFSVGLSNQYPMVGTSPGVAVEWLIPGGCMDHRIIKTRNTPGRNSLPTAPLEKAKRIGAFPEKVRNRERAPTEEYGARGKVLSRGFWAAEGLAPDTKKAGFSVRPW